MPKEIFCETHKNTTTRLSCVSCGKPICPECMIQAPVGYKCRECAQANMSHIEEITLKQYVIGGLFGLIVGAGVGYIWYQLSAYGALISLLVAYAVGFSISRAISTYIGNKIGLKIQIFAVVITLVSMIYNPILIGEYLLKGVFPNLLSIFIYMSLFCKTCLIKLLAYIIASWAAIRHFRL